MNHGVKCIYKPIRGGCLQINPRYDRPYVRCIPGTCLGNPANNETKNPYCAGCGAVPCPTQKAKENMLPGLKITSCSDWSAK